MTVATVALVVFGAGLGVVNAHAQGPRPQPGLVRAGLVLLVSVTVVVVSTDGAPPTTWVLPGLLLGWLFAAGHLWRAHPELQGVGLLARCWTAMNRPHRLREYGRLDVDA